MGPTEATVQLELDALSQRLEKACKEAPHSDQPSRLHGIDCPVNAIPYSSYSRSGRPRFPNAISDWFGTPLTLRERRMIALIREVTDKPDWEKKVFDEQIVEKWRGEMRTTNESLAPQKIMDEGAFNYCIAEPQDYASKLERTEMIPAIDADGVVYKSDTRVTPELKQALRTAAAALENVDDSKKDWHPHSNETVLDLVHPSLYPLLYGRSTVLSEAEGTISLADCDTYIGKGTLAPVSTDNDMKVGLSHRWGYQGPHFYFKKFQWLPCEVAFREDDRMEITSYINNLHPRQREPLFKVLQDVIAKVVPMWDGCLDRSDLGGRLPPRDDANAEWSEYEERPRGKGEEEELDPDEISELDEEWKNSHRELLMPDLGNEYKDRAEFLEPEHPARSSKPVEILRVQQIDTVVLSGIRTSGVILNTVYQLFNLDYKIYVIANDTIETPPLGPSVNTAILEGVIPKLQADVITLEQALGALQRSGPAVY